MSALLTSELSTEGLISGNVETAYHVHGDASAYEAGIHYFQGKDDRYRHCTAILVRVTGRCHCATSPKGQTPRVRLAGEVMADATRASPGSEMTIDSKLTPMHGLVFEVTQEADGGFVAESLGEVVITQADTWDQLRHNVRGAVEAYFFDSTPPKHIRLHLVRDEVFATG